MFVPTPHAIKRHYRIVKKYKNLHRKYSHGVHSIVYLWCFLLSETCVVALIGKHIAACGRHLCLFLRVIHSLNIHLFPILYGFCLHGDVIYQQNHQRLLKLSICPVYSCSLIFLLLFFLFLLINLYLRL